MLGKRCRTLQRTASISQNMGPHYLHHSNYHHYHDLTANHGKVNAEINELGPPSQSTNPHVPATFPQIIGFNPIINQDQSPQNKLFRPPDQIPTAQINVSARPPPHDMYDDDPACANAQLQHKMAGGNSTSAVPSLKQSQIMPRSALQTLLAAARQITCTDQPPTSGKNEGNKSPLIKASAAASPSCATGIYVKQGLWQGFTVSETKSKEISANQSIIKTTIMTTETKAAPECYNVNMGEAESDHNIFYVEGTSNLPPDRHIRSELQQNQHALYLATSPLAADFTPNLAASMSFMESCYLCKRRLGQGRDIFMYRGESAFCSMECRDKQMRMEERKEKLRCMHFKMNNNMQKQDFYSNTNIANSNAAPHHQHHKPHHHHHHQHLQHSSQVYNNKQHRTSLLTPAA